MKTGPKPQLFQSSDAPAMVGREEANSTCTAAADPGASTPALSVLTSHLPPHPFPPADHRPDATSAAISAPVLQVKYLRMLAELFAASTASCDCQPCGGGGGGGGEGGGGGGRLTAAGAVSYVSCSSFRNRSR